MVSIEVRLHPSLSSCGRSEAGGGIDRFFRNKPSEVIGPLRQFPAARAFGDGG